MHRYLLLFVGLLFIGVFAVAQNPFIVQGKVVSNDSAFILTEAEVYIEDAGIGAITNATGNYSLIIPDTILKKTVYLKCHYPGYKIDSARISIKAFPVQLDFILRPLQSEISLPLINPSQITVTGYILSATGQPITDALIKICSAKQRVTSGINGFFKIQIAAGKKRVILCVSKPAFKGAKQKVVISGVNTTTTIRMQSK